MLQPLDQAAAEHSPSGRGRAEETSRHWTNVAAGIALPQPSPEPALADLRDYIGVLAADGLVSLEVRPSGFDELVRR